MKNIITATGMIDLNKYLKNIEGFNVINKDIIYEDGIFEVIHERENVNILIISYRIVNYEKIDEFLEKIRLVNENIELILIIKELNIELEEFINNNSLKYIIENKYNLNENILKLIKNEKIIKDEMVRDTKVIKRIKGLKIRNCKEKKVSKIDNKKHGDVISIAGVGGTGKSIFSALLSIKLGNRFNKILIIDLDILNSSINTIFGVNRHPRKIKDKIKKIINKKQLEYDEIDKLIVNINQNIDLLSGINLLFSSSTFNMRLVKKIISNLKLRYDLIIIDTSIESFFNCNKLILNNSDRIIFLIEGDLLQIKKSVNLLNIYKNNWKIDISKINVIFNKLCFGSVNNILLRRIFSEYKIIGSLKYNNEYIKMINKNLREGIKSKKINNEFERIEKQIFKK